MKGKPFKRLCAMGLSALMLMGAGVAEAGSLIGASITVSAAAATPASSFYYSINDDGSYEIIRYQGSETEVVIPEMIDGRKVTSIRYNAFKDCSGLTSITIPDSVTSIGDYAFYGCTSLTSFTIPDSVTSIGWAAFERCTSLSFITIPNSVTSVGPDTFSGTAWYDSQPDGLVYVGKVAYRYKGEMPKNTRITLRKNTKEIAASAFANCAGLVSISIPNSVTSIEDGAFENCTSLTSITIPSGVSSIEWKAFQNCSSLTSITIPSGVTSIGPEAFKNCSGLTSITIPSSVKSIGVYAFESCSSLSSVTIPDSVTSIGVGAFRDCSSLSSITIPASVTRIECGVFDGCSSLTFITIPASVTSIDEYAFSECRRLTSITIPNSVTSIGHEAFFDCSSLTSITIPNSVTSIGWWAFSDTAWYDSQPDGLVYAGKVAYSYKGEMPENTRITLRKNTKGIAADAFLDCTGLVSITIPNSMVIIGDGAFCNCDKLSSITIPDSVTSIGYCAFENCTSLSSITIPDSVTSIGDYAFENCSSLTSITIPDSVTSIGDHVFSCCSGLASVTIPDSVTRIEGYAFKDCAGLTSITIPDSVTSIEYGAFSGCDKLTIRGYKGTYAETYATENNIPFKGLGLKNTSTISATEIVYGDTVTVACSAAYGKMPYTYAVYYKQSTTSKWTTAQSYSYKTVVTFKPKHVGTYNVCVRAKDTSGKIKKVFFDVTVNKTLKNTSTVEESSIKLGKAIRLHASSVGGLGQKVYEVFYKNESQTTWTKKQSYSTNTEISFKPKYTGEYTLSVKVKDERGKIVKKRLTVTVAK